MLMLLDRSQCCEENRSEEKRVEESGRDLGRVELGGSELGPAVAKVEGPDVSRSPLQNEGR
jgi:hypothetical protein